MGTAQTFARSGDRRTSDGDPIRDYGVGHVFSLRNNALCGISLPAWIALLWRYGDWIELSRYWFRFLFITFMAVINGILGLLDWIFFGAAIVRAKLHPSPVFILGHPRTGTTLMHNLLSMDTDQFFFCTTFQAGFPSAFALLHRISWLFSGFVDPQRPMDNMVLNLSLPMEEELATNMLSGGLSQYMSIFLPRAFKPIFRHFTNYEEPSTAQAFRGWRQSFMFLLKKLSYVNDGGSAKRRVLLKSPVHTGRVRLLLQLFPNAQFIYLHRDPYRVYQSASNMANKAFPYMYLHTPDNIDIQEFILTQYEDLHALYVRDRKLIPKGNLIEMAFSELTEDPQKAVERIYKHFRWGNLAKMSSKVAAYQAANQGFKKNNFDGLSSEEKKMVRRRWAAAFKEFGYE